MAKVKKLEAPIGWLIDPHNKWAIHFEIKKDCNDHKDSDFTIDMWGVGADSKPLTFKSRRRATKTDSLKTWNQLISSNWTQADLDNFKSA